jgi:hypothetical protein
MKTAPRNTATLRVAPCAESVHGGGEEDRGELTSPATPFTIPRRAMKSLSEMDRTFLPYSIHDAQITNLYFPKDAQYVQAMDMDSERADLDQKNKTGLSLLKS